MDKKVVSISTLIISYSYYALVFFTPLIFNRSTYELFEFPKMLFVYTITVTVATAYIIKILATKKLTLQRTPLDIPILLFVLACLVSTIFSLDKYTALFGYYTRFHGGILSILCYIILYYIFIAEFAFAQQGKKILYLMFISTFIITLYAILQRFGLDREYWVQDSQARVFSTLGQPNWLAAYLAMIIPLLLTTTLIEKHKRTKILLTLLTFFSLLAFYFTFSRSGFLALFICLLILFISSGFKVNPKNRRLLLLLIVSSLTTLILTKNQIYGRVIETAKDINIFEGGSTGEIRLLVWKGSLDLSYRSPARRKIFGYGPGNFAYAFLPFRPQELNDTSEWEFLYNKPHNEFLDILANLGAYGLFSFLLIIFTFTSFNVTIATQKKYDQQKQLILKGLFIGWATLLITSFFGFVVVPTALLFWLYPALSFSLREKTSPKSSPRNQITATTKLTILIVIVCSIYTVIGISKIFFADSAYAKGRDLKRGNFLKAATHYFEKASSLNPQEPRYSRDLAQIYTLLAHNHNDEIQNLYIKSAHEKASEAVLLNPYNSLTLRSTISTYRELGKIDPRYLDSAEYLVNFAINYIPTDPVLHYIKGNILLAKGKKETALKAFDEAIELKEDYRDANYAKGLILADLGNYEDAAEVMEVIGELDKAHEYREKLSK